MKNFTPETGQEISHVGDSRPRVVIYTDGGCHNPTGLGGWAALLTIEQAGVRHERMISGTKRNTTSNRMEMTAVIRGLMVLKRPCEVHVVTDSQLVMNCALGKWKQKANKDLWGRYNKAQKRHRVTFEWVKGHSGHPENERVDKEATRRYRQLKKKWPTVNGWSKAVNHSLPPRRKKSVV